MKFLFREKVYNKTEIHGLTNSQRHLLEQMIANHKSKENEEENNETEMIEPSFELYSYFPSLISSPYLKIEIQNCTGLHIPPDQYQSSFYLIVVSSSPSKEANSS